jgi:pyroglutamyl-peptidase
MKVLVTAFGPFAGRAQNASSLALGGLKARFEWLNTRVLPVDGQRAPQRMSAALRQLQPDVVIMLGEACGATTLRLETTAWNELDFTLPDRAGRQPRGQRIVAAAPASLPATMPWELLHAELCAAGFPASCSTDAGRYLCNQLMFHTLHHLSKHSPNTAAGFIHLPLAAELPTIHAVNALALVIQRILANGH